MPGKKGISIRTSLFLASLNFIVDSEIVTEVRFLDSFYQRRDKIGVNLLSENRPLVMSKKPTTWARFGVARESRADIILPGVTLLFYLRLPDGSIGILRHLRATIS
jgi:hypothetical protein